MTNLHEDYQLTSIINACGKMTRLCGAIVLPPIADQVRESLNHFFDLDELQAAAGQMIAKSWGSQSGCVTACTAAGITLSVAACMTGNDLGKVLQLPDPGGMPAEVIIQKGHCINYGAPITQNIRLAGAAAVEIGETNRTRTEQLEHALRPGHAAAVLFVESHHTVRKGMLDLVKVVRIAAEYDVPVIVDGAAQDHRLRQILEAGADLVITSAHKYLCSTTAGLVAGRQDLVDAVYLQNQGIGRGMKAGKEAIIGVLAALEYRNTEDIAAWTAEQDVKVNRILELLEGISGLTLSVDPDPNGCPFSRARLTVDPNLCNHDANSLNAALAAGDPAIIARAHHASEGYLYLDAIEMTDEQVEWVCAQVRAILR